MSKIAFSFLLLLFSKQAFAQQEVFACYDWKSLDYAIEKRDSSTRVFELSPGEAKIHMPFSKNPFPTKYVADSVIKRKSGWWSISGVLKPTKKDDSWSQTVFAFTLVPKIEDASIIQLGSKLVQKDGETTVEGSVKVQLTSTCVPVYKIHSDLLPKEELTERQRLSKGGTWKTACLHAPKYATNYRQTITFGKEHINEGIEIHAVVDWYLDSACTKQYMTEQVKRKAYIKTGPNRGLRLRGYSTHEDTLTWLTTESDFQSSFHLDRILDRCWFPELKVGKEKSLVDSRCAKPGIFSEYLELSENELVRTLDEVERPDSAAGNHWSPRKTYQKVPERPFWAVCQAPCKDKYINIGPVGD